MSPVKRATPEQMAELFGQQRDWSVSLSPTQPYRRADEDKSLMDSHVTAYKRHHGIQDSHIECRDKFQSSLHDSHVARYFEHLAKTNDPPTTGMRLEMVLKP